MNNNRQKKILIFYQLKGLINNRTSSTQFKINYKNCMMMMIIIVKIKNIINIKHNPKLIKRKISSHKNLI